MKKTSCMPASPNSPSLDELGPRPFSFYPPILNIEHNEWTFVRSTWSEILVVNSKTGMELWVPRRFVGELSRVDEPVMIVGLLKELEYRAGAVWPHERRVIPMPKGLGERPHPSQGSPAPSAHPPPAMRMDSPAESRIWRMVALALAVGIVACVIVISIFRGRAGDRVIFTGIEQQSFGLGAGDDYNAVARKLGKPISESWQSEEGAIQYQIMRYKDFSVILMGSDRDKARYIGAVNRQWKPIDSVRLPDGRNTASVLRNLKPF